MRRIGWAGTGVAALAGLLALWAAGQAWFRAQASAGAALTGQSLTTGLATALPTAALVALVAQLVFGPLGRRILGVLVVACGIGGLLAAAKTHSTEVIGAHGWADLRSPAFFTYLVSCVALIAGGVAVAAFPGRRRRTTGVRREDAWTVLDRGGDPTAD